MNRTTRRLTLMLLLLIGVAGAAAQSSVKHGRQKSLMGIEVHFRFDKSQLDLGYMGNDRAFARFAQVVDSIGLHMIDSVVIVSQSSPEGVYEHNVKLSRRRAATMRQAIESRHPELSDRLFVHPDGESWERLRDYVVKDKRMKQKTIDQVLAIIDDNTISIGTRKWRMEHHPIYRYLRKTYYPRIRNSVFCVIYFDIPAPVAGIDKPAALEVELPVILEERPPRIEYTTRKPFISVRTNLLYDAGTALNVGAELYLGKRWSLLADYAFPWWKADSRHLYFQMLNGGLEARRYFDKRSGHAGHYLSAYGHANLYDLSFNAEDAWQGEGWGVGLGYGYVWRPWRHHDRWKMEAFIRVGYYQSLFDPYHAGDPYKGKYYYDWDGPVENFTRRNHRLHWFGPTGVGVTISYDLIMRKVKYQR